MSQKQKQILGSLLKDAVWAQIVRMNLQSNDQNLLGKVIDAIEALLLPSQNQLAAWNLMTDGWWHSLSVYRFHPETRSLKPKQGNDEDEEEEDLGLGEGKRTSGEMNKTPEELFRDDMIAGLVAFERPSIINMLHLCFQSISSGPFAKPLVQLQIIHIFKQIARHSASSALKVFQHRSLLDSFIFLAFPKVQITSLHLEALELVRDFCVSHKSIAVDVASRAAFSSFVESTLSTSKQSLSSSPFELIKAQHLILDILFTISRGHRHIDLISKFSQDVLVLAHHVLDFFQSEKGPLIKAFAPFEGSKSKEIICLSVILLELLKDLLSLEETPKKYQLSQVAESLLSTFLSDQTIDSFLESIKTVPISIPDQRAKVLSSDWFSEPLIDSSSLAPLFTSSLRLRDLLDENNDPKDSSQSTATLLLFPLISQITKISQHIIDNRISFTVHNFESSHAFHDSITQTFPISEQPLFFRLQSLQILLFSVLLSRLSKNHLIANKSALISLLFVQNKLILQQGKQAMWLFQTKPLYLVQYALLKHAESLFDLDQNERSIVLSCSTRIIPVLLQIQGSLFRDALHNLFFTSRLMQQHLSSFTETAGDNWKNLLDQFGCSSGPEFMASISLPLETLFESIIEKPPTEGPANPSAESFQQRLSVFQLASSTFLQTVWFSLPLQISLRSFSQGMEERVHDGDENGDPLNVLMMAAGMFLIWNSIGTLDECGALEEMDLSNSLLLCIQTTAHCWNLLAYFREAENLCKQLITVGELSETLFESLLSKTNLKKNKIKQNETEKEDQEEKIKEDKKKINFGGFKSLNDEFVVGKLLFHARSEPPMGKMNDMIAVFLTMNQSIAVRTRVWEFLVERFTVHPDLLLSSNKSQWESWLWPLEESDEIIRLQIDYLCLPVSLHVEPFVQIALHHVAAVVFDDFPSEQPSKNLLDPWYRWTLIRPLFSKVHLLFFFFFLVL